MKKYLIDGRFLASLSTGIDRYAYQITRELDKICSDLELFILVPPNAKEIPDYKNIRVIRSGHTKCWTQLVFGLYASIHRYIPINLCNEASVLAPKGIVCLHDVYYAENADKYPCLKDFPAQEVNWFLKIYKRICKKADRLITVSEFSKKRIVELLHVPADKITVISNGWQHFKDVKVDDELMIEYPQLKNGYYFTLTSANQNKNVKWVLEASKYNPNDIFVIAGKGLDQSIDFKSYPNIVYMGFASDEFVKTLMKHCMGFIFPSFYEGFGIPPLEALSAGADLIVSDAASLPEIFGKAAHFISPYNAHVDLKELMAEPVVGREQVLKKYSWGNAAKQLHELLLDNM